MNIKEIVIDYIVDNSVSLREIIIPTYHMKNCMEKVIDSTLLDEMRKQYYNSTYTAIVSKISRETGISLEEIYGAIDNENEIIDVLTKG